MASRRLKRWLLILAPFVGVILAEVILRIVEKKPESTPPRPYQICLASLDGRRLTPHSGGLELILSPYTLWKNRPSVSTESFRINAAGLRGPEIEAVPTERKRIVMLGASALFGLGVPKDEDTLPGQLEVLAPDWEVLNAGVVLFQSGQELSYFVTELVDLGPKIVVAYDGWADAYEGLYGTERGALPPGYNVEVLLAIQELLATHAAIERSVFSNLKALTRSVSAKSRIMDAIRRRLPETQSGLTVVPGARNASPPTEADFTRAVDGYSNNMVKLNDFCRSRGIRFLVALQPELGQKASLVPDETKALDQGLLEAKSYRSEFPEWYRHFRRTAMERLENSGVAVIDVGDRKDLTESAAKLFYDVVHATPVAHQMIAAIIREAVVSLEKR